MSEELEKYDKLIRQLIPINELPLKIQNEFINEAKLITFNVGSTIFKQGDEDDFSYFLIDGEIELQGNIENDVIKGGPTERDTLSQNFNQDNSLQYH